jgi:hypothetical protein
MKKLNFLWLLLLAFMIGACDAEDKDDIGVSKSEAGVVMLSDTRGTANAIKPLLAAGSKVGLIVACQGEVRGPLEYTMNSNMTGLVEPLPNIGGENVQHLFYAYSPFNANSSNDPKRLQVVPIRATQEQNGKDDKSPFDDAFHISPPLSYILGDKPLIRFMHAYSNFYFNINTNITNLTIKSVQLTAPDGNMINFRSALMDGTKSTSDSDFAQLYNKIGGSNKTLLNLRGGLSVPNSTTQFTTAYMNVAPFNAEGKKITVVVTASDDKTYTYEINGEDYRPGIAYEIPIYIEKDIPKPVVKDIRVLSLCEVGSLGTKDNTKQWNCYYGALNIHAKEIRRVLFEHFGKGKTVETGVISFDITDIKCCLNKYSDSDLAKYNIIYLNNNARPDAALSKRIMKWLNASKDRVLMLAYDWKDPCVKPTTKDATAICYTTTNYLMFKNEIYGVTPHWYNSCIKNTSIGNYGIPRSRMLVPFNLNDKTKFFWKEGPFKTDLTQSSDMRYWVEDMWWGSAAVTDPNVIPLISYRDARNEFYQYKTHACGAGDGGMILGVDPTKRIVYIGDSEIFSTECVHSKVTEARMAKRDGCYPKAMNNYSKIMGNLWAWMIQEVIQKPQ